MPGYDKTGPSGKGARTGRGMGICSTDTPIENNQMVGKRGRGRKNRNRNK